MEYDKQAWQEGFYEGTSGRGWGAPPYAAGSSKSRSWSAGWQEGHDEQWGVTMRCNRCGYETGPEIGRWCGCRGEMKRVALAK